MLYLAQQSFSGYYLSCQLHKRVSCESSVQVLPTRVYDTALTELLQLWGKMVASIVCKEMIYINPF